MEADSTAYLVIMCIYGCVYVILAPPINLLASSLYLLQQTIYIYIHRCVLRTELAVAFNAVQRSYQDKAQQGQLTPKYFTIYI